jgi:hypothetical protein
MKTKLAAAALGFRVKSGWAMAVLLAGPKSSPTLLRCERALLSDPNVPATIQPYHAALKLSGADGKAELRSLVKLVAVAARRSVKDLLNQATNRGYEVQSAAMVVGSLVDPATLHNEHIRAHGLEGQLFRGVLEDAFQAHGILCTAFLEKSAYITAAEQLRITEAAAKRTIAQLGESHEGPWRAEEKMAALAAWVALAKDSRS